MVQLGGDIDANLAPWYFLAIFAAVASMGGIAFAAILCLPRRRKESIMGENRWSPITIPKFDLRDGFLCLLFIAACIWAFVFGEDHGFSPFLWGLSPEAY